MVGEGPQGSGGAGIGYSSRQDSTRPRGAFGGYRGRAETPRGPSGGRRRFYSREAGWTNARPAYASPEPSYRFEKDENFAAPERSGHSIADRLESPDLRAHAQKAWEGNEGKHNEICDTLQPRVWGYKKDDAGQHAPPDEVVEKLRGARTQDCNLLLNTGPLPDGSIDPTDEATLREVGRRLRAGEA